jgi:hypothetical protein
MPKTLTITKAAPILESKPIEDLVITFTGRPYDSIDLDAQARWFDHQAELLTNALCDILPGGTRFRLMINLPIQHGNLLVIPDKPRAYHHKLNLEADIEGAISKALDGKLRSILDVCQTPADRAFLAQRLATEIVSTITHQKEEP